MEIRVLDCFVPLLYRPSPVDSVDFTRFVHRFLSFLCFNLLWDPIFQTAASCTSRICVDTWRLYTTFVYLIFHLLLGHLLAPMSCDTQARCTNAWIAGNLNVPKIWREQGSIRFARCAVGQAAAILRSQPCRPQAITVKR